MNLFLVAWNPSELACGRLQDEMRDMVQIYPSLDPGTLWVQQAQDGAFVAASISNSPDAIRPRIYVDQRDGSTTVYSGLPADPLNQCAAHRAPDLGTNWEQVRDRLEGTYAVIRLGANPATLEVQTDLLGGEPVYYTHDDGNSWLISNSVLLLERLTCYRPLDELGVSMYLHLGHVVGTRTLRAGIRAMPGAQRWSWTARDEEPAQTTYYPLARLGGLPYQDLSKSMMTALAADLQRPLRNFADHFDTLVCPLTGGKDSRVLASLLIDAGIDASYFTFGDDKGGDARIASAITSRFDLRHEITPIDQGDVLTDWDSKCLHNARAADGMRSLYLLAGLSKAEKGYAREKQIYLWGACGEIARGYFGDHLLLKRNLTLDDVKDFMTASGPGDPFGLVAPDAVQRARSWRDRYLEYCADQGIRLTDIPDVWGNHAVDARRLSNNGRGLVETRDTYTPFASRAFLEAALSLPALQRCTEPLHFGLTRHLVPELHRMPLADSRWRTQNALLNIVLQRAARGLDRARHGLTRLSMGLVAPKPTYHYQDPMFNRLGWFEAKRDTIRELASDSRCSSIWDFVNRERFEKIMSPKTHESVRSRNLHVLFHIATLAYYESDPERGTHRREDAGPAVAV